MARFLKSREKANGAAPGSLIFIGKQKLEKPIVQLIEYDAANILETEGKPIEELAKNIKSKGVSWINIYGIHDLELIQKIGELFDINSLLLEDMLNTDQRPKYDNGENYDAFILKMLQYDEKTSQIIAEQITIILGHHFVLTLQENKGDVFAPVRDRIRNGKGRVRLNDNDYLAYALMDTIVDNYTLLIEKIGSKVEDLEDKIFLKQDVKLAEEIYDLKTELNFLRKSVRPAKDVMFQMLKSENSYFQKKNMQFIKDLNELVIQATDAIELYSNMVSDQLNIYNTNVSNRMNEVMKVLTVFASIFIPLTFIAGIYGMNFRYMPELDFKYSYPIFWMVVGSVGTGLLLYFKNKKWF